jgi:hypothetical protein
MIILDTTSILSDVFESAIALNLTLTPRSFDISDLPFPYDTTEPLFNDWVSTIVHRGQPFQGTRGVQGQLCNAAFGLDVAALKYLLFDIGVSPNMPLEDQSNRTPLLCLSLFQLLADANSRGQYVPILSGNPNWLTKVFDPPLPVQDQNPMASDIMASLATPSANCARWLLRAGADPNARDDGAATALHHASYGGALSLVKVLLEHGGDATLRNQDKRTPLHYALANGHAELAHELYKAGASLDDKDMHGIRPRGECYVPHDMLQ